MCGISQRYFNLSRYHAYTSHLHTRHMACVCVRAYTYRGTYTPCLVIQAGRVHDEERHVRQRFFFFCEMLAIQEGESEPQPQLYISPFLKCRCCHSVPRVAVPPQSLPYLIFIYLQTHTNTTYPFHRYLFTDVGEMRDSSGQSSSRKLSALPPTFCH